MRDGVLLNGERLFLAAWEVMSDWRINDAGLHWSLPSIDFVCIDGAGHLVFIELKRRVVSPRDSLAVLCQVSHRALILGQSFTVGRLDDAHRACASGRHGRVDVVENPRSVLEGYADFYGCDLPENGIPGTPVRRVVSAAKFGPAWESIRASFETDELDAVRAAVGRYTAGKRPLKEFKRYLALCEDRAGPRDPRLLAAGVATLPVAELLGDG